MQNTRCEAVAAASFQEIYFMRRLLHSQWVSMVAARQEHGHYWGLGGLSVSAEQTADKLTSLPLMLNVRLSQFLLVLCHCNCIYLLVLRISHVLCPSKTLIPSVHMYLSEN